jgi:uncharacterized phage-associated protein
MSYSALTVANYFIAKALVEGGQIDPLKLQKLIYFANGWHLAKYGTPLIREPIHAWKYGPVVESVYHAFKHYGGQRITATGSEPDETIEAQQTRELLDEVWKHFGHYNGLALSNLSHDPDGPWAQRTRGGPSLGFGPKMRNEEMRSYFESLVQGVEAG